MAHNNRTETNGDDATDDRNDGLTGGTGSLGRRSFLKGAAASVAVPALAKGTQAAPTTRHLEVVSTGPRAITYAFTATGEIEPANGYTLEQTDTITQNDDGTWTATGKVMGRGRDAFVYSGKLTEFTPTEGSFELRIDGVPVSVATAADPNARPPVSDPAALLGGGERYPDTVPRSEASVVVSTRDELASALSNAASGDVVYVAGDAVIDVGASEFTIPSGVTLASDRGIDGAPGGQIRTDTFDTWPGIFTTGDDVRVTGVRISGPMDTYQQNSKPVASGLTIRGSGCEVDNVEMWGFNHCAIKVHQSVHVHHSHIHHNPMDGLGYAVMCYGGNYSLIEHNYFNYNRHSVANEGSAGYEVRFNRFGPDAVSYQVGTHQPGGTVLRIHHNTFEPVTNIATDADHENHISIRGVPDDVAEIYNNWFYNPVEPLSSPDGWTKEAIIQVHVDEWTNVDFHDNTYGKKSPGDPSVGCPR